jgi:GTP-binding protein Era
MLRAMETPESEEVRGGRCAIAGRPNVGKSTLLNRMLGQKLVIATPRPGTTRSAVLAVYASDTTQIAFVDTPGLARPRSALHKVLVEQAQQGIVDADVVLFLTEAPADKARKGDQRKRSGRPEMPPPDIAALQMLGETKTPIILVINKIDRLGDKTQLLPFINHCRGVHDFAAVVPISATKDKGFDGLLREIRKHLPEGLLYEDEDFLTDRPARFFASEFIREAVIRRTRDEVPYGCAVVIDAYQEDGPDIRISASIVVEKPSHKGIVIGAAGKQIKEIGIEARESLSRFLDRRVHLDLFVKVDLGWTNNPSKAKALATSEG